MTAATRQFGIVTHAQLAAAGFSRSAISRAVAAGRLIPLHQGVFALGHVPADPRAHRIAATLACGPFSALSNSSGGEHLGLLKPRAGLIDVTVPPESGRSRATVRIHRSRLGVDEVGIVNGVRCTSPSRVILDLAATRPAVVPKAIREAGGLGLLDVAALLALLDRYSGRRGSPLIRELLVGRQPVPEFTRSLLEDLMYELCAREGIERPRMNRVIATDRGPYECDCVWFEQRLIIECDSRWHDNPVSATRDALKVEALTLSGWQVQRVRWAQIANAPVRAAHVIRLLLAQRSRSLGARG